MNQQITFYSNEDLIKHLQSKKPTLYHASQTSTVIPFEKLEKELDADTVLGNVSTIKGTLAFDKEYNLIINGFITWKEAKEFCRSHGREIMTSPTEELASVLSGIATSATGERSFCFKNLRSQIISIDYLNYQGKKNTLSAFRKLEIPIDLTGYQEDFKPFRSFKNAPFPRLEMETDLMTGTEGQLGVIVGAVISTIAYEEETYLFLLLPKWEIDFKPHLELFNAVQGFRNEIRACEMIDANSISYLPEDKKIGKNQDIVFLEIRKKDFEYVYEKLLSNLKLINEHEIFEMGSAKCRDLRVSVPRSIFEENSRMGVTKKGTDVQVAAEDFEKLLGFYKKYTTLGLKYNLFGHFGDAHMHFNFMPEASENERCNDLLDELYEQVYLWHGSPFAEHGIGLIKRKFIKKFYSKNQTKVFKALKDNFDPYKQFFREGFMSC